MAKESVRAAIRRIMIERFRGQPRRFKTKSGTPIQGTFYLHLPDSDGIFHVKETKDALVRELERKYAFHDALIRGNTVTRDYVGALIEEARKQNLAEDEAIGDVLEEVAD